MRYLLTTVFILLLAVVLIPTGSMADQMEDKYYQDVADYYNVSYEALVNLIDLGITDEDMPVVLFVADRMNSDFEEVAQMRAEGESWSNVLSFVGLKNDAFYIIISSRIESKTFAPIFEKFSTNPKSKWNNIDFTDNEIVNLVNLKFVSSHNDYSIFDIMAMRDYGKSFARINQQVGDIKAEMDKEQRAQANETE